MPTDTTAKADDDTTEAKKTTKTKKSNKRTAETNNGPGPGPTDREVLTRTYLGALAIRLRAAAMAGDSFDDDWFVDAGQVAKRYLTLFAAVKALADKGEAPTVERLAHHLKAVGVVPGGAPRMLAELEAEGQAFADKLDELAERVNDLPPQTGDGQFLVEVTNVGRTLASYHKKPLHVAGTMFPVGIPLTVRVDGTGWLKLRGHAAFKTTLLESPDGYTGPTGSEQR